MATCWLVSEAVSVMTVVHTRENRAVMFEIFEQTIDETMHNSFSSVRNKVEIILIIIIISILKIIN